MERLGVMRAAIIVWVSGAVASALLAVFVSPAAWALVAGSSRHVDRGWGLAAALVVVNALLAGIGVTVGVSLVGFRLNYASAVSALAVGGFAGLTLSRFLVAPSSNDPTGIAMPAFGSGLWPIQLLLGLLVPAYLIDVFASRPGGHDAGVQGSLEPPYSSR